MAEVRDPWSAPAALNIYTGDHTGARIPLDSGRAEEDQGLPRYLPEGCLLPCLLVCICYDDAE